MYTTTHNHRSHKSTHTSQRTPFSPPSGRGEGQRPTPSIVRSRGLGDYTRRGDDLTCSDRPIAPTPYGKGAGREAVHNAHTLLVGSECAGPHAS